MNLLDAIRVLRGEHKQRVAELKTRHRKELRELNESHKGLVSKYMNDARDSGHTLKEIQDALGTTALNTYYELMNWNRDRGL